MNPTVTFLLVDDDPDDCDFFREAVREVDATSVCFTAENGEDALMKLRKGLKKLPDFIFLDLNMPRMDGKRCLAELKKDPKLKAIPVIIYTTSSAPEDMEETRLLGASYFLTKPSDYQKLLKDLVFVMGRDWSQHPQTLRF
ncbi:response regulator [Larkinella humicola]|uniref:Response regulator n=1 Tax=Larkinella humicola TaxID=2607654 RepID=A0A5N1JDJ2_9BACT|nr:response regulator [Larkinella humicola]KAA9349126.1 response regulator [Larkinella humicola]